MRIQHSTAITELIIIIKRFIYSIFTDQMSTGYVIRR